MCIERTGNSSCQRCLLSCLHVTVDNQRIKKRQSAVLFRELNEIEHANEVYVQTVQVLLQLIKLIKPTIWQHFLGIAG